MFLIIGQAVVLQALLYHFWNQTHNTDGTLKTGIVTTAALAENIELPATNPLTLFLNRTWQSPTRAAGTTYTNSNTYPIEVIVVVSRTTKFSAIGNLTVGSTVVDEVTVNDSDNGTVQASLKATVPPGATYKVIMTIGSVVQWRELA